MEHFSLLQVLYTKWHQRLLVASEVTLDLKIELSGLNNSCTSAFLATKCFFEPFQRKEGQNNIVDLRARSSPQIKRGAVTP